MENFFAMALLLYPEAIHASISLSLNVNRNKAGCANDSSNDFASIRQLVNAFLEYHKSPFNTARMPLAINGRESLL
jgi:hypothetical protein